MKKLYLGAIASLLVLGLASCGGDKKPEPKPVIDENKILVDANVDGYCLLGPDTHKVGDDFIKNWDFDGTSGKMEATSIAALREDDAALADSVKAKGAVALYTIKNVEVAHSKLAGWTTKWGPEGTEIDGAYCLKTGAFAHDAENDADAVSQWIPSKESGKVLSLTPDNYWVTPNFAEDKDENEYDWNTNPVITTGAGIYNVYLAKFVPAVDDALYGIGLVKTADLDEFVNPLTHKGWKLTGTINDWNEKDGTLDTLTDNTITYDFPADALFKVSKVFSDDSGSWEGALGWSNIENPCEGIADAGSDNNIKVTTAGKYTVTVVDNAKLTIAKAE